MPERAEPFRARIQAISPGIEIRSLRDLFDEGLINDVLIVNEDTVYRFAKNERAAALMHSELRVLDLVRPHVPLAVPEPFYRGPDAMAYRLLPGETLSRERWLALDEPDRQAVAEQLGRFLYALHSLSLDDETRAWLPASRAPCRREDWLALRRDVEARIYPLLMIHQRRWAGELFDTVLADERGFDYTPVLVNADLAPYHILFDATTRRIGAVIDFGMAGLGDPATDIGGLIAVYGERLTTRLVAVYPGLDRLITRARFYAHGLELQWVLSGLETGETFWFTAHLGGARDMGGGDLV